MLVVETIAKIRRAFFRQGKSIKAICRELHVSRKVVRKVVRSGATEFRYEREEQPLPKIGRWRDPLDQLLAVNETKATRERLTLIRIYEELRERGYEGGYDAVRRYARKWAKDHGAATAQAYVPLSFAPGEAYQFDWSHEIVLLNGVTVTVKVAHVRLCHSRMLFVRAYPRETQEMVFDAHDRAFALFKGTCQRGIYDNMKTAVEAVYPNAETTDAIIMALSYCRARNLDPFKRPVHIVPMWSSAAGKMIETVWPGIAELRTTAFRTGQYAGMGPPEFGPTLEITLAGSATRGRNKGQERSITLKVPEWCQITITRELNGKERTFVGPKVYWREAYAKWADTEVPNDMWASRPVGQLEKCAEAAALRRAFPEEIGNDLTAEEMSGQRIADGAPLAAERSPSLRITAPRPDGDRKPLPPLVPQQQPRIALAASGTSEQPSGARQDEPEIPDTSV